MKIRMILGLLAALMLAEPLAAVAAPANGVSAQGYATIATPLVSDAAPGAKVEKAWWVRRWGWRRPYWRRPYWRRRFWYRPYFHRRFFWRRRFY